MKKTIIISCVLLVAISLTAFGFINWNDSETAQLEVSKSMAEVINSPVVAKKEKKIFTDFIYDIGTRFNPIKKADLDTIRSFNDIIGQEHANRIVKYKWVTVVLIIDDEQSDIREFGTSDVLNEAQLKLLHSLDYSTNLMIAADYQGKNKETGALEDTSWTPYLTIVPEKQAEYLDDHQPLINTDGKKALMDYLKDRIQVHLTDVDPNKLQPAKLFFTVSKHGTIENAKLDRPSGYPLVDEAMIKLIKNAPGEWQPAESTKGEKVDQEIVVSFGLRGC